MSRFLIKKYFFEKLVGKSVMGSSNIILFYEDYLECVYRFFLKRSSIRITNELLGSVSQGTTRMNSHLKKWSSYFETLPVLSIRKKRFLSQFLTLECCDNIFKMDDLEQKMKKLSPWRQGPFRLGSVEVNSEWVSFLKWQRLKKGMISNSLKGKTVLEVGCSNGYFSYQMKSLGVDWVMGLEPYWLPFMQSLVIQNFFKESGVFVLPIQLEELDISMKFDVVVHMGVLYHQKNYKDHLSRLFSYLKKGGVAFLETIYFPDVLSDTLFPQDDCYAGMTNVYHIPCLKDLLRWLKEALIGQKISVSILDKSCTERDEQRKTEWALTYSLDDFLHSHYSNLTQEGYVRPHRILLEIKKL